MGEQKGPKKKTLEEKIAELVKAGMDSEKAAKKAASWAKKRDARAARAKKDAAGGKGKKKVKKSQAAKTTDRRKRQRRKAAVKAANAAARQIVAQEGQLAANLRAELEELDKKRAVLQQALSYAEGK